MDDTDRDGAGAGAPGDYAERVLDTVELIPAGRVMTYGDVAEWLGEGGPRQVGRVLSLYGSGVPWWRVVRSDGTLLPGHELSALAEYRVEGTPLREVGPRAEGHVPRINMRRARWDGGAASSPTAEPPAAEPPVAQSPAEKSRTAQPPAAKSEAARSQAARSQAARSLAAQSPTAEPPAAKPAPRTGRRQPK